MQPCPRVRAIALAAIPLIGFVAIACGATPTLAPSAAATEVIPSQAPVQASPNPNLVAFTTHVREAASREGQLIRAMAAASGGPNNQLGLAARQLVAWATDEQAWLADNVADTCYEDAWQSWSSGVDDIGSAATEFRRLADRASPLTDAEGQAPGAQLADGGESLKVAADLADEARAACR